MNFEFDEQTLNDLNIISKSGNDSIYSIFDFTNTIGGAALLKQMFQQPISDENLINNRISIFEYFASNGYRFPVKIELIEIIEIYLRNTDIRTRLFTKKNTWERKFNQLIALDVEYQNIVVAIRATVEVFNELKKFIVLLKEDVPAPYKIAIGIILDLLREPGFDVLFYHNAKEKFSYVNVTDYDRIIRFRFREKVYSILKFIYELDVYITVGRISVERRFIFPKTLVRGKNIVRFEGVYHPALKNAVVNSLTITHDSNIVFLTGANMAGKSTFMKTIGIAVYLAHMGFPVAAEKMEFSVMDGMYSTINLSDNLSAGASHFYSEVLRIKAIAYQLSLSKNLFIIFDELFRGTNVKDAFEATVAITGAFAKKSNCVFVVSTHIIEAGEVLRNIYSNISFKYLPTQMNMNKPVYTFQLNSGITEDRHGMIIINNEGILDILKKGKLTKEQI